MIVYVRRKEGVPEVPSPFFADGKPSWVAALSQKQMQPMLKAIAKPSQRFINEIESVHVDGKQIYPKVTA